MDYVSPISLSQQQQVLAQTSRFIELGAELLRRPVAEVPVAFDLRGRTAGMYRVRGKQRLIRYNPWIFAKYFDDSLNVTVPHEVAHYLVDCLHGIGRVRPHGPEWRRIMDAFGVNSRATASFDLEGIPRRRQQQFPYRCGCQTHQLGSRRHLKVQRGEARYRCRDCGVSLVATQQ
ncbi:SprT family zinc-dependent metalloprotease [Porticoccus sp.]